MKRKKYFDEERAFEFIWQNADRDGIWHGDAIQFGGRIRRIRRYCRLRY